MAEAIWTMFEMAPDERRRLGAKWAPICGETSRCENPVSTD